MFPTLLQIGSFRIATYGVLVALGVFAAIAYLSAHREATGMPERQFETLLTGLLLGAVAGAKLLFIALYWKDYGLWALLKDIRYGFVFFGGFLGAVAFGIWYIRKHKLDFWKVSEPFGPALALGHGIGRFGCFAAGCCYGLPTKMPWGIVFRNPDSLIPPELLGVPLHPTELYEAFGNLLLAAFLHFVLFKRVRAGKLRPGTTFLSYIGIYSVLRFTIEFFRGDDRGFYALGLSVSQWVGLGLLIATASLIVYRHREA